MADEEEVEDLPADDGADEADEKKKKKEEPKHGAPHLLVRLFLGAAGLLLIVGFFLPWLNLDDEDLQTVSGMQLVMDNHRVILALVGEDTQRWLLLLIPGFGVALTGVAVAGVRYSGPIAALLGILIVGYGIVTVIIFFFQKTGLGLWLILLGAFLSVATGVVAFVRARDQKRGEEKKKPADD